MAKEKDPLCGKCRCNRPNSNCEYSVLKKKDKCPDRKLEKDGPVEIKWVDPPPEQMSQIYFIQEGLREATGWQ